MSSGLPALFGVKTSGLPGFYHVGSGSVPETQRQNQDLAAGEVPILIGQKQWFMYIYV